MSDATRFSVRAVTFDDGIASVIHSSDVDGEYVLHTDYARLKAEVERLVDERCLRGEGIKQNEIRIARLKAKFERLTKAGDAMAADLIGEFGSYNSVDEWNAAKKGCQP